jgi:hypothetical protein
MIAMLPVLILYLLWSGSAVDLDCPLILKQHSKIDGLGVYAGKDYKAGEVVERCVAVSVPEEKRAALTEMYAFEHKPGYQALVLGYGMVYNTHANHSLKMHSAGSSARVGHLGADSTIPTLVDYYITALYDIPKGGEMFTDYGGENWFTSKGIPFLSGVDADAEDEDGGILLPGCPSGKVEIIGGKVYATQIIQAGEVVEVSRGLILPGDTGDGSMLERLLWFREQHQANALLVLGYGALYEAADPEQANLHYGWYEHEEGQCDSVMLVEFVATRRIEPNELLTVPMAGAMSGRRHVVEELFGEFCF